MRKKYFASSVLSVCAALVLLTGLPASADELAVIELHHRSADDLLPALKPLAGANVSISGIEYKLLVRGNSADVARIREAVAALDRAQKQLMISVRYGASPQTTTNDVRVTGGVSDNNPRLGGRAVETTQTVTDANVSSIRVLEGNRAFIASGQSVPVITAIAVPSANGPVIAGSATDYREMTNGFSVLPRINGKQVILEISSQQNSLSSAANSSATSGAANITRATSTLTGQLGEWIVLAGVDSSNTQTTSGINGGAANSANQAGGSRRVSTQSDQRTIAVKVDEAQ